MGCAALPTQTRTAPGSAVTTGRCFSPLASTVLGSRASISSPQQKRGWPDS